ncbi:MAG: DinB family protein [Bacteroidota bacterium]
MRSIKSITLLNNLQSDLRQIILQAKRLEQLPVTTMTRNPSPEKWNIAQVLEHLNFYSRHYIHAVEQQFHGNEYEATEYFKPGWLGNYFTALMKPRPDNSIGKKMKAPKNALPSTQPNAAEMLQEFMEHQHHLLNLLQIAKSKNLGTIRIPTSISKLISLKLGDTFRFFMAHEQRHFIQIEHIRQSDTQPVTSMA